MSEETKQAKFAGVAVRIGDLDLTMPSLSVKQAEKYWPTILALDQSGASREELSAVMSKKFNDITEMVHAALSRNYPAMSLEELKDTISISQIKSLVMILLGQSGLESAGEPKPGETRPTVH